MENAKQSSKPNMSLPSPEELGTGRVSHAETCLFWRCARHVLKGDPASDNVVVCVPGRQGRKFPLLIMTLTKAKRLICWPVLPNRVCAPEEEDKLHLTDHVTLELTSKRSHSTEFHPRGGKRHPRRWKVCSFDDNGVSLWFGFAVRLSAIENQVLERHQWIRMPKSNNKETKRRSDEFKQFFEKLRFVDANVPGDYEPTPNAVVVLVYIVDGAEVKLSEDLLQPLNQWPDEFWERIPEPRAFNVISTGLAVGGVQLGLLLGFPPYNLREDGPILATPRQRRTEACLTP